MTIPIVIGVTGHRDLREQDVPMLRELVRAELQKLKAEYSHSPLVMLNSLASGADQLCAEAALELGISLICPLPMPEEEYLKDFEGQDIVRHKAMLARADEVFTAPEAESAPAEINRDFKYRQAGIYMAAHSHVLLALWDGFPARPGGCGTAETVDFMLNGTYGGGGSFKAANDGAVIHIMTPRHSGDKELPISVSLIENEPGSLREVLRMTDVLNKDAEAQPVEEENGDELLPEKYINGSGRLK